MFLSEKGIELALVIVIAKLFVKLGTCLHQVEHVSLRAVAANGAIYREGCLAHRTEGRQRIENQSDAGLRELRCREQRRLAELGDIGEHWHGNGGGELTVFL